MYCGFRRYAQKEKGLRGIDQKCLDKNRYRVKKRALCRMCEVIEGINSSLEHFGNLTLRHPRRNTNRQIFIQTNRGFRPH